MHIVDSTLFFAPHSGGVKRYLLAKKSHFEKRTGVRHSLLVPGNHDVHGLAGIEQVGSPLIPFGGGYRFPLGTAKWRRRLIELAPDIIEAGDPYHPAWSALSAGSRLGIPTVLFAHSNLSSMLERRFGRAIGAGAKSYLRALYRRFDLIMAPSRSVAMYLREMGIERVTVQPLGVDEKIFHPRRADPALREKLRLTPDTRLLAFAGRMAREKRVPWLIRAITELGAPYHLLLIGGEHPGRLADNVTAMPYQHGAAELANLLASVDALVHAGDQETFGMVFIEAMACGRPVIGMRCDVVNELIDDSVGRVADPRDIGSLEDAIESLYRDDLAALGANARRRVEQRYTWDRTFAGQLETYMRLHRNEPIEHFCLAPTIGAR